MRRYDCKLRLLAELTLAGRPAILCPITECNDNEQEEYAHLSLLREPAVWCEAGASAGAEWFWELRSEPREGKREKVKGKSFNRQEQTFPFTFLLLPFDSSSRRRRHRYQGARYQAHAPRTW